MLDELEVRCQFDPDKNLYGENMNRRAIQLGLKGEVLYKYANDEILGISDITEKVHELKAKLDMGIDISRELPVEREYTFYK